MTIFSVLPASLALPAALINHLWQSSLVTVVAWLLAITLRRNQARARYWVWMIASAKFLIPFALLMAVGESLRPGATVTAPAISYAVEEFTQPFSQAVPSVEAVATAAPALAASQHVALLPYVLGGIWLCGSLTLLVIWFARWRRLRGMVQTSRHTGVVAQVPVFMSASILEPGVFGILRPVLLLPEGITERLTPSQLDAIIAHELCHIRRRDNLTAAIHMAVEAIFWFHPAVWWIQSRLLEERERACDEAVLLSGNAAETYAEGILNVCRSYIESPLCCVSGVTGSDLKQRIVRIMTEQVIHKLDLSRKLLLGIAAAAAVTVPITLGLVHVTRVHAQAATGDLNKNIANKDITDTWQGTMHAGRDLRTVVKITKDEKGGYKATFASIDEGPGSMPLTTVTLNGMDVRMTLDAIDRVYTGKLSADGKTIDGMWTQGGSNPLPVVLTRATPETAWAIPEPPPRLAPMPAGAHPVFEVATIKPSKPDAPGKMFRVQGRKFNTLNTTLSEIISFAYGVHARQVVGAPAWVETDKFDLEAVPDLEGAPSDRQLKEMIKKLLADRFKLSFHKDRKDLSVYVLAVAKTGPKLEKNNDNPDGLPGIWSHGLGDMNATNATMQDFAELMQSSVLDRPVVDHTGIVGRYNFKLKWTPDDSQFAGMAAHMPPPTDAANAPPALYTAIQEQIGLKLDPARVATDVLVVDHVEKPSAN